MQAFAIILMCIASAVVYGIVHDQITARVCVEYFTIGHAPVFPTESPTLLGLGWGVIATWWVGLILGIGLAIAARAGRRRPRTVQSLFRTVATLLLVMGLCAAVAGVVGFVLGRNGTVTLLEPLASRVPPARHARFLADLWAHRTSYLVGLIGGMVVIVRVWHGRRKGLTPVRMSR